MREIVDYIRERYAALPPKTEEPSYGNGYRDALKETEEFVLDLMWDRGEDDEEADDGLDWGA